MEIAENIKFYILSDKKKIRYEQFKTVTSLNIICILKTPLFSNYMLRASKRGFN